MTTFKAANPPHTVCTSHLPPSGVGWYACQTMEIKSVDHKLASFGRIAFSESRSTLSCFAEPPANDNLSLVARHCARIVS